MSSFFRRDFCSVAISLTVSSWPAVALPFAKLCTSSNTTFLACDEARGATSAKALSMGFPSRETLCTETQAHHPQNPP
jgi:hypothetical protein